MLRDYSQNQISHSVDAPTHNLDVWLMLLKLGSLRSESTVCVLRPLVAITVNMLV